MRSLNSGSNTWVSGLSSILCRVYMFGFGFGFSVLHWLQCRTLFASCFGVHFSCVVGNTSIVSMVRLGTLLS
jgi:hypothetical protein